MDGHWKVTISEDRLQAELELCSTDHKWSFDELLHMLKTKGIIHGVKEDVIERMNQHPTLVEYPVLIAVGTPPKSGKDAYLLKEEYNEESGRRERLNYLNYRYTASVKQGSLIATMIPPTPGFNGMDVLGHVIPANNGELSKVSAGRNVIQNNHHFYSLIDGEISLTEKNLSVNPIFQVDGDLEYKQGEINFDGNVIIKGNVLSGCIIKANGDIKIFGMVEEATLQANGHILIKGGVSGGKTGFIRANGSIHVNYLNQAAVWSGQDIHVHKSILHSRLEAKGSILSHQAILIGGTLTSKGNIHVKEIGNHLFAKTEICLEENNQSYLRLCEITSDLMRLKENHTKLTKIEEKILKAARLAGRMSVEHRQLLIKQKATKNHLSTKISKLMDEQAKLAKHNLAHTGGQLFVYESLFPNTKINYGKYAKLFSQKYHHITISFSKSEFIIAPINEIEKNKNQSTETPLLRS
ncbi:DUF342 domain-containing protein [Cytobacillus purgationiresistens]|uniref:Uncharacterized protein (DUF342 family) n=1 Tax=Cytobacillus purgationiresistens TaxID=863449 RepID=A0ABU0AG29_9BACI|nr:FapA family protein [Cytobacillus purgationiresistens]MDQ0270203.1 uncharacterized protein (DUF342 family) [Cytobacillus purgationiresistens]